MKFNYKSRKGFTLIELLVVIGILAVLAAIAIPSVAGLIDRANVSADNTNANEYTNAIERFASEYELYCQDIASGVLKDADNNGTPDDMDSAQGRVFNVTGAVTRADITALESTGFGAKAINRDTKYPMNSDTLKAIIQNYTKTSSSTFEPKQSDCHFYYSSDCGLVVCAKAGATAEQLNKLVVSGMDAKGNKLDDSTAWMDTTNGTIVSGTVVTPQPQTSTFTIKGTTYTFEVGMTFESFINSSYNDGKFTASCPHCGSSGLRFNGSCVSLATLAKSQNINDTILAEGYYTEPCCPT